MHRLAEEYGDPDGPFDWSKVADVAPCVPALLRYVHAHHAERELSVFDDRRLTYGEAHERSAQLARQLLGAGAGKGTRIGMIFPNSPEFLIVWFAIVRIGAVAVPISTLSTAVELANIIRHADLHFLITADRYLNHDYVGRLETGLDGLSAARPPYLLAGAPYLREIWVWGTRSMPWAKSLDFSAPTPFDDAKLRLIEAEVSPADPSSIIYTSGSTAAPKGVIHTHGGLVRQGAKLAAQYPYMPGDRVFTQMPFFWVGGLTVTLLSSMHVGATILGSGQTGGALLDFLERERVTYMTGWPHLMRAIENDPTFSGRDFTALRGGTLLSPLPPEKRPKNQIFGNALGMTETAGPHTISLRDYPDEFVGSFGPPMPGMQHKIVDLDTGTTLPDGAAGELLVRGDSLMAGFVKRERETAFTPDGWYRTGDLCSFRQGLLFFHGRTDDTIKSSGANVSPREVEAALTAIEGVVQAIVVSVPDEARGAVVGAIIVVEPGVALDEQTIRKTLAVMLSSYKVPRVMKIMETKDLPILSSSKVDRRLLVRLLTGGAPAT